MTADRLALATRTMKARRSSTCPACGGPITVGQAIAKLASPPGWCHLACIPAVRQGCPWLPSVRCTCHLTRAVICPHIGTREASTT